LYFLYCLHKRPDYFDLRRRPNLLIAYTPKGGKMTTYSDISAVTGTLASLQMQNSSSMTQEAVMTNEESGTATDESLKDNYDSVAAMDKRNQQIVNEMFDIANQLRETVNYDNIISSSLNAINKATTYNVTISQQDMKDILSAQSEIADSTISAMITQANINTGAIDSLLQ